MPIRDRDKMPSVNFQSHQQRRKKVGINELERSIKLELFHYRSSSRTDILPYSPWHAANVYQWLQPESQNLLSILSQNPGKLTAREDWRSEKQAAAPQGYFSQSTSFMDLFLVLIIRPTLLQVVFNKKLRSGKDYLSVNTLKNIVMLNLFVTIKKINHIPL